MAPRIPWTEAQLDAVRRRYADETTASLAESIGRPCCQVNAMAVKMGLKKSVAHLASSGGRIAKGQVLRGKAWTPAERDELRLRYADEPTADIALSLGRSTSTVLAMAQKMGLRKSEAFMASPLSGRCTPDRPIAGSVEARYQPGNVPWSRGTKGVLKPNSGTFRKGQVALNLQPVGAVVLRPRVGYWFVKVSDSPHRWEFLHIRNWVAANGPVPAGHLVVFRTADKSDCSVANLRLATRAEHMMEHSICNYPGDLRAAIRALSSLNRRIRNG